GKEGPMSPALKLAAAKHLAVGALNVERLAPFTGNLPQQAEPFKPLFQAKVATVTLDVDGQGIHVQGQATFPGGDETQAGDKALKAAIDMARQLLPGGIQQLSQQKDTASLVPIAKKVEEALQSITVERKGTELHAAVSIKADLNTLGATLAQAIVKV